MFSSFHVFSLETLEATLGNVDIGDQGVELVHAVLVLVTETSKTNAHTEGNVPAMSGKTSVSKIKCYLST